MTDTTPVVPTDAEIEALGHRMCWRYKHDTGVNHISTFTFHAQTLHDFARAVLAKWGTPAPVGVEPIGYLYCGGSYGDELAEWEIVADQLQCDKLNEHHGSLGKEAKLPIYTTTQPNHAQAVVCEPLIRQMRYALALPCDRWNATQSRIVREAINAADAWLEGKK